MDKRRRPLELTQSQVENLMEFLEFNLIPSIRADTDIDNINYLTDMCDVYKKLKKIRGKLNGNI